MTVLRQGTIFWAGLSIVIFAAGILIGLNIHGAKDFVQPSLEAIFEANKTVQQLSPAVQKPVTFAGIFIKNTVVILLVAAFGHYTLGLLPGFICFVNGAMVGVVFKMLLASGIAPYIILAGVLTHGIIELPALFWVCGFSIKRALLGKPPNLKERNTVVRFAVLMLFVAAAVETWVTPRVLNMVVG